MTRARGQRQGSAVTERCQRRCSRWWWWVWMKGPARRGGMWVGGGEACTLQLSTGTCSIDDEELLEQKLAG